MAIARGVIEQKDSRDVKARGRMAPTYSFRIGNDWYRTGFKEVDANVGDDVEFPFTDGKWGKEVDPSRVEVKAAGVGVPAAAAASSTTTASRPSVYSKGVFPIPALDGQRSIVRQSALKCAVDTYAHTNLANAVDANGKFVYPTPDEAVDAILLIASRFEAYSCGDLEAAALAEATKK